MALAFEMAAVALHRRPVQGRVPDPARLVMHLVGVRVRVRARIRVRARVRVGVRVRIRVTSADGHLVLARRDDARGRPDRGLGRPVAVEQHAATTRAQRRRPRAGER